MTKTSECRVCGGVVREFFDFGKQPLSDAFVRHEDIGKEFFFRLATGICESCTMVQLVEEVSRDRMFHEEYPYLSSGSELMREHFENLANRFRNREVTGPDPFIVEIGCNDGVMLKALADAGIRHLGVEPSGGVAELAIAKGIEVRKDFFDELVAVDILVTHGYADVIFAANTLCHIPYIGSVLRGVTTLLAPKGVFVFEDPYFAEIIERTAFDQIYDEHFFFFTVQSVQAMAAGHGLEVVDVEWLPVHGGELRYTLAFEGARPRSARVNKFLSEERARKLTDPGTLERFGVKVEKAREELVALLGRLRDAGKRVAGYGATAKSATVLNYCGIGPNLVTFICDTSPTKQGKLTPGSHIPVRKPEEFANPYPDYAVLFAWNHSSEIVAKEHGFREAGGQWIRYVPEVHVT